MCAAKTVCEKPPGRATRVRARARRILRSIRRLTTNDFTPTIQDVSVDTDLPYHLVYADVMVLTELGVICKRGSHERGLVLSGANRCPVCNRTMVELAGQ